jgi:hypothetical protein
MARLCGCARTWIEWAKPIGKAQGLWASRGSGVGERKARSWAEISEGQHSALHHSMESIKRGLRGREERGAAGPERGRGRSYRNR